MSTDTKVKWEEYLDKAAAALEVGEIEKAMGWVALTDAHSRAVLAEKSPNLAAE